MPHRRPPSRAKLTAAGMPVRPFSAPPLLTGAGLAVESVLEGLEKTLPSSNASSAFPQLPGKFGGVAKLRHRQLAYRCAPPLYPKRRAGSFGRQFRNQRRMLHVSTDL